MIFFLLFNLVNAGKLFNDRNIFGARLKNIYEAFVASHTCTVYLYAALCETYES